MKRALLLFLVGAALYAAPCIHANADCTEWVALGGPGEAMPPRGLIYRTFSLDTPNPAVTRALVMVHGTNRDADHYFRTAVAAAFVGDALADTVVIVPRIASADRGCHDTLAPGEVSWSCGGSDSWRSGGAAAGNGQLTSFDFMDEILRKLALKRAFPNLKSIVVVGHSAGGQFVTRYEMANRIHETLGVPVSYVVANPSSYAWPDATRPAVSGDKLAFRNFGDAGNCTTYNRWPYGLENRTGYASKISDDRMKHQLVSRPATYLLGEIDILPLGGFDDSCPAMAQGPTRRARGEAFGKLADEKLGARHKVVIVELCGHNARCMFTSDEAMPALFPK